MTDQVGYSTSEDRTMPAICYGLYLLAFATGITAIIGVIIAYAQRSTAGPDMHSHYTFLIRTFWLGIVFAIVGGIAGAILMAIGAVLTVILIGFPIMAIAGLIWGVTAVWFGLRCILGLVYLSRGEAYPRPYAVLA
jgi:uncharacterized membrane protein